MTAIFDTALTLKEVCDKYHADIIEVTTLLELLGGLSKEKVNRVLYQANVAAAAERFVPQLPTYPQKGV